MKEENRDRPTTPEQSNTPGIQKNESDYKNVETAVNNPEYFDDEYETEREDQLTDEEDRTEDDGRSGKR